MTPDIGQANLPSGYDHVTLDAEDIKTGKWHPIAWAKTYDEALELQASFKLLGLQVTISCACGSYEAGECVLCDAEDEDEDTTP